MNNPLLITIVILVMIIFLIILSRLNTSAQKTKKKERLLKKLESLKNHIDSDNEYERKDAIIRLDNLLAKALNYRYNNSSSCGENLKKASNIFRKDTYQNLWDVHKLRNDAVHNNKFISKEELGKAYRIYKLCIKKILR